MQQMDGPLPGPSTASDIAVVDPSGAAAKWTCSQCTYINYPLAAKCIMCRVPRPLRRIEDAAVASAAVGTLPAPDDDAPQRLIKWTCAACTYLNWPRSARCVQCGTEGRRASPPHAPSPPPSTSTGCSSSSASVARRSTTLDSRIVAKKLQKWTCHACTFENWPKTAKCVMCHTARVDCRPTSPPNAAKPAESSASHSPTAGKRGRDRSHESTGRKSPKSSSTETSDHNYSNSAAAATTSQSGQTPFERQLCAMRRQPQRHLDFLWLTAVRSIVTSSCDCDPVEAYLAAGGDPGRALTVAEAQLLQGALPKCRFEAGFTVIHLALCYSREDLVPLLLASADPEQAPLSAAAQKTTPLVRPTAGAQAAARPIKRVPCHASPDTAAEIRRLVCMSLRQRKGQLPCFYFTETTTFFLPNSIYELAPTLQQRVFDEILDRPVQKELEEECAIINWSLEVTDRLGSRLFALWNRTAGDCLLDSVLQATWGVFDSENSLRQALTDSLHEADYAFYPRWREHETLIAKALQFSLDEDQLSRDWHDILRLASQPGSALEQAHVFALAHIVRRPIIVYGVRVVKSYQGDYALDYARFEGVYLPLLWEPSFCTRSPICLGFTRGHFVALVPMQPAVRERQVADAWRDGAAKYVHLPLQDSDGKLLPVRFMTHAERGHEQALLRTWLDVTVTDGGLWCCRMKLGQPPALVLEMTDDWLTFYRRLGQMATRYSPGCRPTDGPIALSAPASPPPHIEHCEAAGAAEAAADCASSSDESADEDAPHESTQLDHSKS